MPHLTGVELVEALRKRNVPGKVIVLSAHLSTENREAYERMKVDAIFPKPFDLSELRAVVERVSA